MMSKQQDKIPITIKQALHWRGQEKIALTFPTTGSSNWQVRLPQHRKSFQIWKWTSPKHKRNFSSVLLGRFCPEKNNTVILATAPTGDTLGKLPCVKLVRSSWCKFSPTVSNITHNDVPPARCVKISLLCVLYMFSYSKLGQRKFEKFTWTNIVSIWQQFLMLYKTILTCLT